jgi:hypothetical protein
MALCVRVCASSVARRRNSIALDHIQSHGGSAINLPLANLVTVCFQSLRLWGSKMTLKATSKRIQEDSNVVLE